MFSIKYLAGVLAGNKTNGGNGHHDNNDNHDDSSSNGHSEELSQIHRHRRRLVIQEVGKNVYDFIRRQVLISTPETLILSTTSAFNILNQERANYDSIVNLRRVNDIRRINKFFEAANSRMVLGGHYVGCVDTYSLRKRRILGRTFPPINYLHYTLDFFIRRVFPKLPLTKRIYFFFSRGNGRVLSRAETFGRLHSCGFEVINEQEIDGRLYYVACKTDEPAYDYSPTYGPLVKLNRLGKDKKIIKVYKLRTMHAYSEYLQGYVYQKNHLTSGGKFKNDFRVTTLGAFVRKFWIDELPMFINLFRGDMKLVGVRPLSRQYFNLYDDDLQDWRSKYRPGLIPPYYADMPKTIEEIQASERRYLKAYEKAPLLTDWRYFWKVWYNILFKKARSA